MTVLLGILIALPVAMISVGKGSEHLIGAMSETKYVVNGQSKIGI